MDSGKIIILHYKQRKGRKKLRKINKNGRNYFEERSPSYLHSFSSPNMWSLINNYEMWGIKENEKLVYIKVEKKSHPSASNGHNYLTKPKGSNLRIWISNVLPKEKRVEFPNYKCWLQHNYLIESLIENSKSLLVTGKIRFFYLENYLFH